MVATHADDLTRLATDVEELGITITQERLIRDRREQPFDHFGAEMVE